MSDPRDDDWDPPATDPEVLENARAQLREMKRAQWRILNWAYLVIAILVIVLVIVLIAR